MRQKTLVGMVAICWLVSCAGVLRAQRTQGTISGTVSDSSGAVIPNAEVTITHQQTGTKRVVTTNESGFYTATALDPGTYTVTAKWHSWTSQGTSGSVSVNDTLTHFVVTAPEHKALITQMYFATDPVFEGDPGKNYARDPLIATPEVIRPVTLVGDPKDIHAAVRFEPFLEVL